MKKGLCYNFSMNFFDAIKSFDGVKFKDAEFNVKTNCLTVNFLYNPTMFKLADNVSKIEDIIRSMVDRSVNVNTHFTKCSLDETAISLYAFTTIANNFPVLNKNLQPTDIKVEIDNLNITLTLSLVPKTFEYATSINREKEIKAKLEEGFYGNFIVRFEKKQDFVGEEIDVTQSNLEFQNSIKMCENKVLYKISKCQHIFNKTEYNYAIDFSKPSAQVGNAVICGKIVRVDKKTYKKKHTSSKGDTTYTDKNFYIINLNNEGKYIYCSCFPNTNEESRGQILEVGKSVVASGKFESYGGRVNFTARSLALCEYEKYVPPVHYKTVNENYHTVFPEKYQDFEQFDLFNADEEIELKEKDKSFVVFDFETTGLDAKTCEIIEIGAVKIEGGKIVSTFSTFVKPSQPIPQEITDLTTITNKMVEDSPSINYVLPDFYKYCYGAGLVAHNIAFDYGFLSEIAKKMNYNFDNPQYDTLNIARQKLLGLKNFKLETVANRLGVSLVGAHRAVNDAMATAKCFLKML